MSGINVGIIGAGGMAEYHYDGFVSAGANVVAIADSDAKRAGDFAKIRNITGVYTGLTEMLKAHPDIGAVSVITPNKFHKPLTIEALNAGKHVYCEKPPALNAAETKEMLDAAEQAKKRLMFAFNNRARAESQTMIRYIRNGKVGKINSVQANWIRRNGIPGFGGWFTTKALSGGGPVIDLLHMLDLALYFLGYPEPVYLIATAYYDFMDNKAFKGPWGIPDAADGITDVESACHAMLTFKTGQCMMIRSSWAEMNEREAVSVSFQGSKAGGKMERIFEIYGKDDTSVDSCYLYTEEYGNQVDMKIHIERDESMGRTLCAANFIDSINGKAEALSKPHEAFLLMKIIDAIYESAATKKPVQIH
jgi:predicted dehydrogenase